MKPKTTASITIHGKKITIEHERDDLDIYEIWEEIIKPLLLATGYTETTVNRIYNEQ